MALLLVGSVARAQGAGLQSQLQALITKSGLAEEVSFEVAPAVGGDPLFSHQAQTERNPASNMKLLTAAAALKELGADYTMSTNVYASGIKGDRADVVTIRSHGDPSLEHRHLLEFGAELRKVGIRKVGELRIDGSFFDNQILPPAYDQQPDEVASFRAPVSAVAVDRNSFVLQIRPGPKTDAPAVVVFDAPGYFKLQSKLVTVPSGQPNVIASQKAEARKLALYLEGAVPSTTRMLRYRRRIADPLAYAAHSAGYAFSKVGVKVEKLGFGTAPNGSDLIYSHRSESLAQLLHRVGKYSDNFYAEMILKVMGAEPGSPGSSKGGLSKVRALLREAGVSSEHVKLVNGSGLFDGNAIAPADVIRVLQWTYSQPLYRSDYLSQLAISGVDGTLAKRMRNLPPGTVRAKTGTLNDVIALSGYVLGRSPSDTVAFSFLANGVRGKHSKARKLADDLCALLAKQR